MNPTMQKVLLGVGIAVGAVLINVGAYVAINSSKTPPQPTVQQPVEKPAQAPKKRLLIKLQTRRSNPFDSRLNSQNQTQPSRVPQIMRRSKNLLTSHSRQPKKRTSPQKNPSLIPLSRSSNLVYSYTFDEMLTAFDPHWRELIGRVPRTPKRSFRYPGCNPTRVPQVFELTLEELEKGDLATLLDQFLSRPVGKPKTQTAAAPSDTRPRFEKVLAQITVARVLLTPRTPQSLLISTMKTRRRNTTKPTRRQTPSIGRVKISKIRSRPATCPQKDVLSELTLIFEASQMTKSPLWREYNEIVDADYTQYPPQSLIKKLPSARLLPHHDVFGKK